MNTMNNAMNQHMGRNEQVGRKQTLQWSDLSNEYNLTSSLKDDILKAIVRDWQISNSSI